MCSTKNENHAFLDAIKMKEKEKNLHAEKPLELFVVI